MNIELTLCDKELNENIESRKFNIEKSESLNEAQEYLYEWLEKKDFQKSVFVCFETINDLPDNELREQQCSILVSHRWDDITDFCDERLNGFRSYDVDFAVFEFEDYQEAFDYCKDLREGF